jgi:hypothetical protein
MYIQEQEKENRRLSRTREKNIEASDRVKQVKATKAKQSKYMRYREAKVYYCLGMNTIQRLAKEAGATIRIGRCVLIDTEIFEKYIDSFRVK